MSLIFRPVVPEDESLVTKWLEQDEVHKALGLTWKDITAPNTYSQVVLDQDGVILEVIRYHLALRVAMQFNPDEPYRVAKHAPEVVEKLKELAEILCAKEIIICPGGKAVQFADKLGFVDFVGSKRIGV